MVFPIQDMLQKQSIDMRNSSLYLRDLQEWNRDSITALRRGGYHFLLGALKQFFSTGCRWAKICYNSNMEEKEVNKANLLQTCTAYINYSFQGVNMITEKEELVIDSLAEEAEVELEGDYEKKDLKERRGVAKNSLYDGSKKLKHALPKGKLVR